MESTAIPAPLTPLPAPRRARSGRVAPLLAWTGKRATDAAAAPREVRERPDALRFVRTVGDTESGNALIHGDNAAALRTLLGDAARSIAGTVKLCYLDPPFNTGERFDAYSDARPVDTWLSEIHERLELVRSALHADGSVWFHIDDRNQHYARQLLDEVFGTAAFVSTVIWQKRTSRDNRTAFSSAHEYLHVYAPAGAKRWKTVRNGDPDLGGFANPDADPRGPWRSVPMSAQAGHATKSQFYTVTTPTGHHHDPPPGRAWTYTRERFEELARAGRVYWPRNGDGRPRLKRYEDETSTLAPSTIWMAKDVDDNAIAKKEVLREAPDDLVFDTPKPTRLLARIIEIASDPGDLVLDPYFGSGALGAAALARSRRWIGIENQDRTIDGAAIPRLERVIGELRAGTTEGPRPAAGFDLFSGIR